MVKQIASIYSLKSIFHPYNNIVIALDNYHLTKIGNSLGGSCQYSPASMIVSTRCVTPLSAGSGEAAVSDKS